MHFKATVIHLLYVSLTLLWEISVFRKMTSSGQKTAGAVCVANCLTCELPPFPSALAAVTQQCEEVWEVWIMGTASQERSCSSLIHQCLTSGRFQRPLQLSLKPQPNSTVTILRSVDLILHFQWSLFLTLA